MFDILGIQYRLENGFRIGKSEFKPVAYLVSVDEPEFGCEGRPEEGKVCARLQGITMKGTQSWKLDADKLEESGLYDDMWIGFVTDKLGTKKLASWRAGNPSWEEIPEDVWNMRTEME